MLNSQTQIMSRIRKEVGRLVQRDYAEEEQAFCHYALQTLYGLDDDDAAEACNFGSAAVEGAEALWDDEESGRIVLATMVYHADGLLRVDRRPAMELARVWLAIDPVAQGSGPSAYGELAAAYAQAVERNPSAVTELLLVVTGAFTSGALRYAQSFNDEHPREHVQLRLVDLAQLADADFERLSRDEEPPHRPITLQLRRYFEEETDGEDAPTLVASIDGTQLAEIEREHRFRIFQRNVRYQLPGKINENIDRTLKRQDGRRKFWYYNNGISIVCDRYTLDEQRNEVRIQNMQIVNGCQTTTTLAANLETLSDPPPTVLVRIIASEDEELQRDITLYNNRQNAVRDRDLLANDAIQEELQIAFANFDPPWFYERKRGAWKAEAAPSAKERKRFESRQINNEKAAQAAHAFHHDPGEARARKRSLFVPVGEGGFYERLFNASTTPEWLLVPYLVNDYVAGQKREYVRDLRRTEKLPAKKLSTKDKQILQRVWLKFADQALVGTMAFYWRQRVKLGQDDLEALLSDGLLARLLPKSYSLAVRDLSFFFVNLTRDAAAREETFVPSNYLKGNWSDILGWLSSQDEYRVSVGEDPFSEFLLLSLERV